MYQVKETNHHEHDFLQICIHLGDVRLVYVKLQQLREIYSLKAETFANVTQRPHVHTLVMIINSQENHVSL